MSTFASPFGGPSYPGRVPVADSTENVFIRDVVGNKADKSFSNGSWTPSVIGHLKAGYFHVHSPCVVYPNGGALSGADPLTITASATTWLHGAKAVVLDTDQISKWFDIHWVIVSNVSAVGDYEIILYSGAEAEEAEVARIAFSRNAAADRSSAYLPVQIPPQSAGARITASLACSAGSATAQIKVYTHTYPDIA